MQEKIVVNAAVCTKCNTLITSKHDADYQECHCRAIWIDGGYRWLHRGGEMQYFLDQSKKVYDNENTN